MCTRIYRAGACRAGTCTRHRQTRTRPPGPGTTRGLAIGQMRTTPLPMPMPLPNVLPATPPAGIHTETSTYGIPSPPPSRTPCPLPIRSGRPRSSWGGMRTRRLCRAPMHPSSSSAGRGTGGWGTGMGRLACCVSSPPCPGVVPRPSPRSHLYRIFIVYPSPHDRPPPVFLHRHVCPTAVPTYGSGRRSLLCS
jgi:hypothetical protein